MKSHSKTLQKSNFLPHLQSRRNLNSKSHKHLVANNFSATKLAAKLLILALSIPLFVGMFCAQQTCFASVNWARVTQDNVYLYATNSTSKVICTLEKSYYVQILAEEEQTYLVGIMQNQDGFAQISGYVWKNDLQLCDEPPLQPYYPTVKLTVCTDSAMIKLSPTPSANNVITVTNTQQVLYYGTIESYGEKWYYVCYGGKFGYCIASNLTNPQIQLHPTPLVEPSPLPTTPPATQNQDVQQTQTSPKPSVTAEVMLILFVVILAVSLVLALFLPGNHKRHNVFDNDL